MKKLLKRTLLLDTKLFQVSESELIDPHGVKIKRILVEHGGSTVVMPVDDQGRVLLVRQYRFPVLKNLWELPAGKIDEGETALQAAKRELLEETGYNAKSWKKLIAFYPSPGFQQEKMTIYLAQNLMEGDRKLDHGEENLIMRWYPAEHVAKMIRKGVIVDAKTILGMYAWRDKAFNS